MPVRITQFEQILLNACGTELRLAVDRRLPAGNAGYANEAEACRRSLRPFIDSQKWPVSGKGSVGADQLVKIVCCDTWQPGGQYLNLLREHTDVEGIRAKQIAESLPYGSVARKEVIARDTRVQHLVRHRHRKK